MKAIVASIVLALTATSAQAHDFWLDLKQYQVAQGGAVPVSFLVGDAADIQPWRVAWEKIVSLRSYGPDGVRDQQAAITPTTAGKAGGASVAFDTEGTHVLALESHHASITMPAAAFNAYLAEDGLTAALEHRRRQGASTKQGREIYSRRAKALVQVGDRRTDNVTQPIGHSLEIVPERNPYALAAGETLPVRIYFLGKPLAGARVMLGDLDAASEPATVQSSDAEGHAQFDLKAKGRWRLSVIWTRPLQNHPGADFETVFSTLTFGFDR